MDSVQESVGPEVGPELGRESARDSLAAGNLAQLGSFGPQSPTVGPVAVLHCGQSVAEKQWLRRSYLIP